MTWGAMEFVELARAESERGEVVPLTRPVFDTAGILSWVGWRVSGGFLRSEAANDLAYRLLVGGTRNLVAEAD